jgi:Spy/CpxP family protein refolding chaperone
MFGIFGTVVAVAAISAAQTAGPWHGRGGANSTEIIEIDGGKTPELIPEYLLWEHGFGGLAIIKERQMTPALESLALSAEDAARVFGEAAAQADRERRRSERERARRTALAAAKPSDLAAALRDVILDYRWDVLNARDRLLDSLTPEGRTELLRWMSERRTHITAYVPKGELDFFRQPR